MPAPSRTGLLVDFGGVLTTNIWDSFDAFCATEGLERGTVLELFRADGEALALLRSLERGAVSDAAFEADFGELLGVEPEGLIERPASGASAPASSPTPGAPASTSGRRSASTTPR